MNSNHLPITSSRSKQIPSKCNEHLTIDCSLKHLSTEPPQLSIQFHKPKFKLSHHKPNKEKQKRRRLLNHLYGISDDYSETLKKLKRNKNLSLQEHQTRLLELSTNLRKENILRLNKDFKNLRQEISVVHPLPPLNYKNLLEHSKMETIAASQKRNKISLHKLIKNNSSSERSAFDLDMERIKYFKPQKENLNIALLYEILPEHIVRPFAKQY